MLMLFWRLKWKFEYVLGIRCVIFLELWMESELMRLELSMVIEWGVLMMGFVRLSMFLMGWVGMIRLMFLFVLVLRLLSFIIGLLVVGVVFWVKIVGLLVR